QPWRRSVGRYGLGGGPGNWIPWKVTPLWPCSRMLGSLKRLSSVRRLKLTRASFVIDGLNTETRLPAYERPTFSPIFGVGSATTSPGAHHTPRGLSAVSVSWAARTYAFVLLLMFQSNRDLKSVRFV